MRVPAERYGDLFDSLPLGVVYQDGQGRITSANPAAQRILGLSLDQLQGRTSVDPRWRAIREDGSDFPGEEHPAMVALRSGEVRRGVLGVFNPESRRTTWISVNAVPQLDPSQEEVAGVFTTFEDITDRKLAEADLREAQGILQAAMDQSPAGIAVAEAPSGNLRYVNDAGLLIRGGTRESVVKGVGIDRYVASWQLLDLDGTPLAADAVPLARAIRYGEANSREFIIRRAPDDDRIVVARAAPVKDAGGKVTSAVVVFLDITESRRAEQAVTHSEAKYRGLFDSMMDGFVLVDMEGHILESNEAYRSMLGYSAEELKRKTYVELTPEPWHAFEARLIAEQVLPRDYSDIYEKEYRRKDGTVFPVELRTFLLKEAGVPVAMWAIVRDVTAIRALQVQLVQSQKLESIGRLAGGVAHDFNNMLGVILGHAELALAQDGAAQPLRDDLQEIQKAARRSADLTKQLLAFARKQTVSPVLLDLNATVASSLQLLRRMVGENVELRWKPADEPLPIMMDPSQVDQLLTNLCVNARDSIKDVGALTIEAGIVRLDEDYCRAHPEAAPGDYVRLVVSDTGCGMDRETMSHLFEPFFTTKARGQGTGLGLATIHGVVKQNGGFINVYSEPGAGTAFSIYLPRHRGRATSTDQEGTAAPPVRGHETILLVEDEPAILRVTKRMLEGQGYVVLAASTPGAAIQLAREHSGRIQLLLTDVVMPEMNGRTLAKNLLSISPDLKSLFMSGYTADVIAHQGVLAEGVNFVQKPFSALDLGTAVRKALDG